MIELNFAYNLMDKHSLIGIHCFVNFTPNCLFNTQMLTDVLSGMKKQIKEPSICREGIQSTVRTSESFYILILKVHEPRHEKTGLREFPSRSGSNPPAHLQKLAWGLEFWLQKLETLHYLGSEQQRCWSDCADAHSDLHLCCSHMTWQVYSWPGSH